MRLLKSFICVMTLFAYVVSVGCSSSGKTAEAQTVKAEMPVRNNAATPKAVVYKTIGNYDNNVPVALSDDKSRVMSYPHPRDVSAEMSTPVRLDGGYLLDRRGIGRNAAFLDYTYEEYSKLEKAPSADSLMAHVIAKNPIAEMYMLPITAWDARRQPSLCNEYIANGFKGCTPVMGITAKP